MKLIDLKKKHPAIWTRVKKIMLDNGTPYEDDDILAMAFSWGHTNEGKSVWSNINEGNFQPWIDLQSKITGDDPYVKYSYQVCIDTSRGAGFCEGWVYKGRMHKDYFTCKIDSNGSTTNGWDGEFFRPATVEEGVLYREAGERPTFVLEPKIDEDPPKAHQEFIKGDIVIQVKGGFEVYNTYLDDFPDGSISNINCKSYDDHDTLLMIDRILFCKADNEWYYDTKSIAYPTIDRNLISQGGLKRISSSFGGVPDPKPKVKEPAKDTFDWETIAKSDNTPTPVVFNPNDARHDVWGSGVAHVHNSMYDIGKVPLSNMNKESNDTEVFASFELNKRPKKRRLSKNN